jgi:hypothetical protein
MDLLDDPKKRREAVLAALSLRVSKIMLENALTPLRADERDQLTFPTDLKDRDALEVIAKVRKQLYDDRRDLSRDADRDAKESDRLAASLPRQEGKALDQEGIQEWITTFEAEQIELRARLEELAGKIAEKRSALAQYGRDQNTRVLVKEKSEAAESAKKAGDRRTAAMTSLDDLALTIGEQMPFGLSWGDDGELCQNGKSWDQLNTAAQLEIGYQLAVYRRGTLPVLLLDSIDHLDHEHRRALFAWAEPKCRSGELQLIGTRAMDGPLSQMGWNPDSEVSAADYFEPEADDAE